jgi:hypothetical protein
MLRMCVYMHSRFVENHPIRILEDGPLISKGGSVTMPVSAFLFLVASVLASMLGSGQGPYTTPAFLKTRFNRPPFSTSWMHALCSM